MLGNWENWCRLCAKCCENGVCKMESISNQLEIVNKHFTLSLYSFPGVESSMCTECISFVVKLDHFRERCIRAENMFMELFQSANLTEEELRAIRIRHGVDDDEIKFSNIMPQTENEEQLPVIQSPITVDPLFMEVQGRPSGKEIKTEMETITRRRGRPRKSTKPLSQRQPKVKEELSECESNKDDSDWRDDDVFSPPREKRIHEKSNNSIKFEDSSPAKRSRTRGEKKEHICDVCSKKYTRKYRLEEHIRSVHSNEEKRFVCSKCPKRFSTEKKVKLHEVIHVADKPFICEECGKSFATNVGLKEHQIIHSDERPFQCSYCPKKFKNMPRLKTHEDTHNNTTYTCPHCGITLNTKQTLLKHMVVHSDVKKYKCEYCGNEYKRSKALKNHLILHSGLRPYSCPFCSKTFANGSNCRSHKKKAHPAELAALEASGVPQPVTTVPRLEHLQPK
ncbi:hypothetical protein DMENIID0001_143060 [Sergentomyia squamirostris]